jgi:hypothetical protein
LTRRSAIWRPKARRGLLGLFPKGLQRQENLLGLALRAEQDAEGFRVCCDPETFARNFFHCCDHVRLQLDL